MKTLLTTIAFLFVSTFTFAQAADFPKLDQYFEVLEENDRFHGSVTVSRDGELIYSKTLGFADVATQRQNTSTTKFRIGSISKTFTAVLTMKAVENGKISLDQTIEGYFPEIENAASITIRQLLNHQSGIGNFTDREYFDWHTEAVTPERLLEVIKSKGSDFAPGTDYAYSNSNYILLTWILEDALNKSYAQLLKKHITKPLKLANTGYGSAINTASNEARSYRKDEKWEPALETHMSSPLGAGGIVSTTTDLCRFAEALFDGEIISPQSLAQMKPATGDTYGFALELTQIAGLGGIGHGGDIDAFTADLTYLEKEGLAFALTSNGINYGKHDIATAVLSEITGQPYELPNFDFVELNAEELDQYLGTYESDELPIDLTISKEGNELIAKGEGQAPFTLDAQGDHKFTCMEIGLEVEFFPAEQALKFGQGGMVFEMTRKAETSASAAKQTKETVITVKSAEAQELGGFTGTYTSDQLPIDLTISTKDNQLYGQGTGQPAFPLEAEGDSTFSNKAIGLKVTFLPQQKMLLAQGDAEFEMTKE